MTFSFLLLCHTGGFGQELVDEIEMLDSRIELQEPIGMAASPGGGRIAICDAHSGRISVIDLRGRLLWVAGAQVRLDFPQAPCFENENEILFATANKPMVLRVSEKSGSRIDTVADLTNRIRDDLDLFQISRGGNGKYLVIDRRGGRILNFDRDWDFLGTLIPHGPGLGNVLEPTSISHSMLGWFLVTGRRARPAQAFARDGSFLFQFGWNQPSLQHRWKASASTIDSREIVWIADETNRLFRLYDQAGTEIATVPFPDLLFQPVAMVATIGNQVAVLGESGRLLFYSLR